MARVTKEQLNFIMRELLYWHLELKPAWFSSDRLIKTLYVEKILDLPAGSVYNMSAAALVALGQLHDDPNIRRQFIDGIPEKFWSM